jgi:hypothetical protein
MKFNKSNEQTKHKMPSNQTRRPSKPWDTVLNPFLDVIDEMLRRRPPISLRKIQDELSRRHGIRVAHSTVASVLKARKKERKVRSIDPSFLSKNKSCTAAHNDAVERLRRKADVKPEQGPNPWDELEIKGPLSK